MAGARVLPLLVLALAAASGFAKVCEPVGDLDLKAYSGRWYNVYYDKFTTLFSSPVCSTAYYELNSTSDIPSLTANNSGVDKSGDSEFLTGYVAQHGELASDLTLHLTGVPKDATYRVCALGNKTYGAGYYEWSVVTDDNGLSLYVLARDVKRFFSNHDTEVTAKLDEFGYKGLLWGVAKNVQDDCPSDIYFPAWSPH